MIIYKCDQCHQELTRNMVSERLVVEQGHFIAEVVVSKDNVSNDGDLCYDCLIKMLTTTPKKPRKPRSDKGSHKEKKPSPEPITGTISERKKRPDLIMEDTSEIGDKIQPEPVLLPVETKTIERVFEPIVEVKAKRKTKEGILERGGASLLPDISTFTIKSPEPGMPQLSTLSIGEVAVLSKTLREGVTELLGTLGIDREYVEAQAESEGKRNLLDILKEGGKI